MGTTRKPEILVQYANAWVAVKPDYSVVAAAKTIKKLKEKLVNTKDKNLVITYVLPLNKPYAP